MMGRDMRAMQPTEPVFWLVMSLGVVVGFAVAYPVNVWMVARNLKHGLMTVRPVRAAATHEGHEPAPAHAGHASAHAGHGSPARGGSAMPVVTRPQLAAMAMVTTLALFATPLWAASKVNLGLSTEDVGGVVMPPGMIMPRDMPAEAMRDMAAVDPADVRYTAPDSARGGQVITRAWTAT